MPARKKPTAQAVKHNPPVFPYTERPGALRRFLTEAPNRPRPPKVNMDYLAGIGMSGGPNASIIRVLKAVGLLNDQNEPTETFTKFMHPPTGPAVLAERIRALYPPLFGAHHRPDRETTDTLRNLFNIHSGGAPGTIDLQIQTFKALCESANFDAKTGGEPSGAAVESGVAKPGAPKTRLRTDEGGVTVHIDLHIHLPPGKTARDYQYIIQDIGRYIYGNQTEETSDDESGGRG